MQSNEAADKIADVLFYLLEFCEVIHKMKAIRQSLGIFLGPV